MANQTTTNNTYKPYSNYEGQYVLYGQNYEFAIGAAIWRGRFNATGRETAFNVSLSAGSNGVGAFYVGLSRFSDDMLVGRY